MYTLVQTVCRLFTCGHEERKCWDDTCNLSLPLVSPPALLRGAHLSRDMPPGPQRWPLTAWGTVGTLMGSLDGQLDSWAERDKNPKALRGGALGPRRQGLRGTRSITRGYTHAHTRLHSYMLIIQWPRKPCRPRRTLGAGAACSPAGSERGCGTSAPGPQRACAAGSCQP